MVHVCESLSRRTVISVRAAEAPCTAAALDQLLFDEDAPLNVGINSREAGWTEFVTQHGSSPFPSGHQRRHGDDTIKIPSVSHMKAVENTVTTPMSLKMMKKTSSDGQSYGRGSGADDTVLA